MANFFNLMPQPLNTKAQPIFAGLELSGPLYLGDPSIAGTWKIEKDSEGNYKISQTPDGSTWKTHDTVTPS